MHKRLIIFLLISTAIKLQAADTTYYDNGNIHTIHKHHYKSRVEYYQNGNIKQKSKQDKLWRKGRQINYDSLGLILSKGKTIYNYRKHGKWKFYGNGKIIDTKKYKFGISKEELYTTNGKRAKCYLTYGLGARHGPCEKANNHYKLRYIPVAGCLVSNKLQIKTSIHNFFIGFTMSIKYGFNWNKKINKLCDYSNF